MTRAAPMSRVLAVSRSATHHFSKHGEPAIRLLPGLGVEGRRPPRPHAWCARPA